MGGGGILENGSTRALASYWGETSRPLVSLIFVAPMLLAYEGGLLLLGPAAMRNGADLWLRDLLEAFGFSHYFLLPLLTTGILLAWHHLQRQRWHVDSIVLYGMLLESITLGFVLLVIAQLENSFFVTLNGSFACALSRHGEIVGQVIAFFGAGIYEELLFRLMMVPALAALFRFSGAARRTSLIAAVFASSLLFAAAHYRFDLAIGPFEVATPFGDPFAWGSFVFRLTAGVFFSLLFVYRGFGIAVGTHALYDILVALV